MELYLDLTKNPVAQRLKYNNIDYFYFKDSLESELEIFNILKSNNDRIMKITPDWARTIND